MGLCNSLTHSIKICLGGFILAMGTMTNSMSALAQEEIITDPKPLEIHTGTVQDLNGIQSQTREEWLGGVGGEYAATEETTEETTEEIPGYQVDRNAYKANTDRLNITLEDYDPNLGDGERPAQRIPLIEF